MVCRGLHGYQHFCFPSLFQKATASGGRVALLARRNERNFPCGISFLPSFFLAPLVPKKKADKGFKYAYVEKGEPPLVCSPLQILTALHSPLVALSNDKEISLVATSEEGSAPSTSGRFLKKRRKTKVLVAVKSPINQNLKCGSLRSVWLYVVTFPNWK